MVFFKWPSYQDSVPELLAQIAKLPDDAYLVSGNTITDYLIERFPDVLKRARAASYGGAAIVLNFYNMTLADVIGDAELKDHILKNDVRNSSELSRLCRSLGRLADERGITPTSVWAEINADSTAGDLDSVSL